MLQAVEAVHVNICDLIEAPTQGKPQLFLTERDLAEYSISTRRIFPRYHVNAGSLLRFLLRRIHFYRDTFGRSWRDELHR